MKSTYCIVISTFLLTSLLIQNVSARHRCPQTPASIISSITMAPLATIVMTTKASNTSGCKSGHPSSDFYTPPWAKYFEESFEQIVEESSRGTNDYLYALTLQLGCPSSSIEALRQAVNDHYILLPPQNRWRAFESILKNDPDFNQVCQLS